MLTADAIAHLSIVPNTLLPRWQWTTAHRDGEPLDHREPSAIAVCTAAGLTPDEGVLACVLASEFPLDYPAYLLAGAACVINDATALWPDQHGGRTGGAILARCTTGAFASGCFGHQGGRWCSTWQPPTLRALEAARLALQGTGAELAAGGRRWIDLRAQDGGMQAGQALPKAEAVLRSRYADGWRLVAPKPAIDQYVLAVLARHEGVGLEQALAVLADGRRRWHKT